MGNFSCTSISSPHTPQNLFRITTITKDKRKKSNMVVAYIFQSISWFRFWIWPPPPPPPSLPRSIVVNVSPLWHPLVLFLGDLDVWIHDQERIQRMPSPRGGGVGVGLKVCLPLSHLFYSEPSHLVSLFSIIITVLSYYHCHIISWSPSSSFKVCHAYTKWYGYTWISCMVEKTYDGFTCFWRTSRTLDLVDSWRTGVKLIAYSSFTSPNLYTKKMLFFC